MPTQPLVTHFPDKGINVSLKIVDRVREIESKRTFY